MRLPPTLSGCSMMRAQLLAMGFAEHRFEAYLNTGLGIVDVVAIVAHQHEEHKVSPRLEMLFICLSLRSKAPVAKTLYAQARLYIPYPQVVPQESSSSSVSRDERPSKRTRGVSLLWEQIRLVRLVCLEHCVTRPSHCTDLHVDSCQRSLVLCEWCQKWYHVDCVNQAAPKWVCLSP